MGNHTVGRAMVHTAEVLAAVRDRSGQTALQILDAACREWSGYDAEFDDALEPDTIFGKLMLEAFAPPVPDGMDFRSDEGDIWWEKHAYDPFRQRYDLC